MLEGDADSAQGADGAPGEGDDCDGGQAEPEGAGQAGHGGEEAAEGCAGQQRAATTESRVSSRPA
jgi:hypothetical protein